MSDIFQRPFFKAGAPLIQRRAADIIRKHIRNTESDILTRVNFNKPEPAKRTFHSIETVLPETIELGEETLAKLLPTESVPDVADVEFIKANARKKEKLLLAYRAQFPDLSDAEIDKMAEDELVQHPALGRKQRTIKQKSSLSGYKNPELHKQLLMITNKLDTYKTETDKAIAFGKTLLLLKNADDDDVKQNSGVINTSLASLTPNSMKITDLNPNLSRVIDDEDIKDNKEAIMAYSRLVYKRREGIIETPENTASIDLQTLYFNVSVEKKDEPGIYEATPIQWKNVLRRTKLEGYGKKLFFDTWTSSLIDAKQVFYIYMNSSVKDFTEIYNGEYEMKTSEEKGWDDIIYIPFVSDSLGISMPSTVNPEVLLKKQKAGIPRTVKPPFPQKAFKKKLPDPNDDDEGGDDVKVPDIIVNPPLSVDKTKPVKKKLQPPTVTMSDKPTPPSTPISTPPSTPTTTTSPSLASRIAAQAKKVLGPSKK